MSANVWVTWNVITKDIVMAVWFSVDDRKKQIQ